MTFAYVRATFALMTNRPQPRRVAPLTHDPEAVRWARERAGWKQAALAREVGISPSTLCEIERGTRGLTPDVRKRLAEVLNCPVTVLERKREVAA